MSDFLFHKVTEKEKEEIKKQAKSILDDFSKKLSKIDKKKIPESFIERPECERQEKKGKESGNPEDREDFSKEIMFKNAPNKNKDFIIAEKKTW